MSRPDDAEFVEFFRQQYPVLVRFLVGRGASFADAEDVVQEVFMGVLAGRVTVRKPRGYFYRALKNEIIALAEQRSRELDKGVRWAGGRAERSADDVYHRAEIAVVRNSLAILPPRQREILALACEGCRNIDIAEALGIVMATVRSNLRFARKRLQPYFPGDGQELHLRAGEQLWEAWHRGETLPIALRPVIAQAWDRAKALGVDPEHGAEVVPLGRDEVQRRRDESLFATCPSALDVLAELGRSTEQMMVVVDGDGVVLWRDGDRKVLRQADQLGFVDGACWDLRNAGANGIALALTTGRAVQVSRWEHFVQTQHHLSCFAVPVRDPRDGRVRCVLNLTGTAPTVYHATQRKLDTIALRLHQQLRTA